MVGTPALIDDAGPAAPATPGAAADYFDGRSSRPRRVWLQLAGDLLQIRGDEIALDVPRRQVQWPERTRHGARVAHLPDGGSLQARDAAAWDAWLRRAGHRDSLVVRAQQSWRGVLVATLVLVAAVAAGYRWGLPLAAGGLLAVTPQSADLAVGRAAFESMDGDWLKPSRLPAARREQLAAAFARAVAQTWTGGDAPAYELHFRHSPQMGPNAFALPGGIIVMTDQLVQLLSGQDDAILGVLAHELGHVRHRHGMRSVIQVGIMGTVTSLALGDFSSVMASAPVLLGQMAYSRDFERQADDEAIAMLQASGRSPEAMVVLFERLAQARRPGGGLRRTPTPADAAASRPGEKGRGAGGQEAPPAEPPARPGDDGDEPGSLGIALSSHPADAERIARFRAAARAGRAAAPRP